MKAYFSVLDIWNLKREQEKGSRGIEGWVLVGIFVLIGVLLLLDPVGFLGNLPISRLAWPTVVVAIILGIQLIRRRLQGLAMQKRATDFRRETLSFSASDLTRKEVPRWWSGPQPVNLLLDNELGVPIAAAE